MSKKKSDSPIVRKDLNVAVETILTGIDNMFKDQNKSLDKRFQQIDERFDKVEGKIQVLDRTIKDETRGFRAELSDTASKKELNKLKARVDSYQPTN